MRNKLNYAKLPIDKRIQMAEQLYIRYPRLVDIMNKISHCHEYSKHSIEPVCLFIKGPSGTGKSSMYEQFEQKYPRRQTEDGAIVPVLAAGIPIPATIKNLATRLLKKLGDPAADKGTTYNQTLRLNQLVKDCRVELIILDEFQHFIDRDSDKVMQTISDWLKTLINDTRLPMVVIGMPHADEVLDANAQLRRRFSARVELKPFSWKISEHRLEFRAFLKVLDENLPLIERSNLADEALAFRFYCASKGIIGYVMKIARRATGLALQESRERLTLDLLKRAYEDEVVEESVNNGSANRNPFDDSVDVSKFGLPDEDLSPERVKGGRGRATKKYRPSASDVFRR